MPQSINPIATPGCRETSVHRFEGLLSSAMQDVLAVEEPLEIRLVYGPAGARETRSISVTMRTPGNDAELALGFLFTEGVIRDANDIDSTTTHADNTIDVSLAPHVEVSLGTLQRNFYTTSSCGICGKASLLALRTVCPPRVASSFAIAAETLYSLPGRLEGVQGIFRQTGGLHAAALFTAEGELHSMREDVGRHNALDKLVGAALLSDQVPLRGHMLLLSGRASFELLQKAVMAGIPLIASVGAPSSLAVQVAKEFDVALIGFLRNDHFNVYNGAHCVAASGLTTNFMEP
jgi:FdhD protein